MTCERGIERLARMAAGSLAGPVSRLPALGEVVVVRPADTAVGYERSRSQRGMDVKGRRGPGTSQRRQPPQAARTSSIAGTSREAGGMVGVHPGLDPPCPRRGRRDHARLPRARPPPPSPQRPLPARCLRAMRCLRPSSSAPRPWRERRRAHHPRAHLPPRIAATARLRARRSGHRLGQLQLPRRR